MPISRRDFVGTGLCAAMAAAFSLDGDAWRAMAATARQTTKTRTLPITPKALQTLGNISRASLEAQINTVFSAQGGDGRRVDLRLKEVAQRGLPALKSLKETVTESYSAIFSGPPSPTLLQGTYTIRHARIGTFVLFLVPVGRGNKPEYEAVFNRLRR